MENIGEQQAWPQMLSQIEIWALIGLLLHTPALESFRMLRVTVLLVGEPLPQSQVSYRLGLPCTWFIHPGLNSDQFPSPCC